ncbi:MAG TPA: RagB/SusD family nutrient uptake outer membrane protein [Bacteroidales bacterium]|nr:RagB/SusD family nutrient uptake outer membrane protein [Bacteroidales bacterium]
MKRKFSSTLTIILLSALILFFASSCDQLVEKPTDFVGPDNFFTTPAQIESAFTASMDVLFGGWTFYDWYGYPEIFEMDDQVYGGDLVIGDDFGSGCWQKHFRAISFINPAIKALNAGQVTGISQEKADELMAQAKFLRGWNYFMLVRYYGGVPLIEETTDATRDDIPRASVAEVYDLIVNDLLFATQHLPVKWGEENKARPAADAAKTLLAKVYITMAGFPLNETSNYAKARDMAKQVIDAGNYWLVPDVEDVFEMENTFGPEFMWCFHNSEEEYVIEPQIWLPGEMAGGWGDTRCEKRWGEAFPEEPRKHAYLLLEDPWFGTGTTYLEWGGSTPYVRKYLYDSPENMEKNVSYQSMPILRYADALLLFAEAENQVNGPTQAACDAVNQIVNRATGGVPNPDDPLFTTSMTKEEFDEAIIQQRSWELCFEYDRWFDIQRKRILDKVTDPEFLQNYSIEDYLLPIPQKDLRLNKALVQNPGYTSP